MTAATPEYTDAGFRQKLQCYAVSAGREVVERAVQLFYALQSPDTPKWARTVILGALAYFILPADAIPDMIPGAGYADDLGALAAALAMVHLHITDEIRTKAASRLADWFPSSPANGR